MNPTMLCLRRLADPLGGGDIDRRAIHQDRAERRLAQDRVAIDAFDMLAGGQHRHHRLGAIDRFGGARRGQATSSLGLVERLGR